MPFKLANLDRTKTALLVRLDPYRSNPALNEIFYCHESSLDLNKLDDRNLIFNLHPLEARVAYAAELRLACNTIAMAYLDKRSRASSVTRGALRNHHRRCACGR